MIGTSTLGMISLVEFVGGMIVGACLNEKMNKKMEENLKILGSQKLDISMNNDFMGRERKRAKKEKIMENIEKRKLKCLDNKEYQEVVKKSVGLLTAIKNEIRILEKEGDCINIFKNETRFSDEEINLIGEIFRLYGAKSKERDLIILSDIKIQEETFRLFNIPRRFDEIAKEFRKLDEEEEKFYVELVAFIFDKEINATYKNS